MDVLLVHACRLAAEVEELSQQSLETLFFLAERTEHAIWRAEAPTGTAQFIAVGTLTPVLEEHVF